MSKDKKDDKKDVKKPEEKTVVKCNAPYKVKAGKSIVHGRKIYDGGEGIDPKEVGEDVIKRLLDSKHIEKN